MRPANSTAAGLGPMAALQSLEGRCESLTEKQAWLEESRLDAILGASSRSHKSVRSGIRCWMAFVGACVHSTSCECSPSNEFCLCRQIRPSQKAVFPTTAGPAVVVDNDLPIWADTAKLFGIRADRVPHVQRAGEGMHPQASCACACVCCSGCPLQVFEEPALKKAKCSVDKALNFKRRERMFISRLVTHRYYGK